MEIGQASASASTKVEGQNDDPNSSGVKDKEGGHKRPLSEVTKMLHSQPNSAYVSFFNFLNYYAFSILYFAIFFLFSCY